MIGLHPQRRREIAFMIKIPGTKRNQHNLELKSLGFVYGQNLNGVYTTRDLDRLLFLVEIPPLQKHTEVTPLAGGKLKDSILECLEVRDLTRIFSESENSYEGFRQFKQRQLLQRSFVA